MRKSGVLLSWLATIGWVGLVFSFVVAGLLTYLNLSQSTWVMTAMHYAPVSLVEILGYAPIGMAALGILARSHRSRKCRIAIASLSAIALLCCLVLDTLVLNSSGAQVGVGFYLTNVILGGAYVMLMALIYTVCFAGVVYKSLSRRENLLNTF